MKKILLKKAQRITRFFLLCTLVITRGAFRWIHFSPAQHFALFHDAFTLKPLLCKSHLFIVNLKINTSISTHWASFSITAVWLQWYCDDKEKHCNKLPDWDNIMTPLHLSAEETPCNSATHPHPPNLIQRQSACKCSLSAFWGKSRMVAFVFLHWNKVSHSSLINRL